MRAQILMALLAMAAANVFGQSTADSTLACHPYRMLSDGTSVNLTPMFQAYAEYAKATSLQLPPEPIAPMEGQMGRSAYEYKLRNWKQQKAKLDEIQRATFGEWKKYSGYVIMGEVLSVTENGILLNRYEAPVFLRNYPSQQSMVDGYSLKCVAFISGRYQYTAVSGAAKTVIAYDYGKPIPPTDKARLLPPVLRVVE